jgi:hypothetical protein
MPAWHLYNIKDYYKMSRLLARRLPLTMAEFSRDAYTNATSVLVKLHLLLVTEKNHPNVVPRSKYMRKLGYREFFLTDDIFTSDQKWAKKVCDAIPLQMLI